MARVRLGVALLLPSPTREEVDGLRRALGGAALGRVPPHLTLVPPVNVREESLGRALATLRRAAGAGPRRLRLTLGPVSTFLPDSPVIYLAVAGVAGDLDALQRLRDNVFSGPLERPLSWPFVPHVTLADQTDRDRIAAAVETLAHYHAVVTIEAVHLLQEVGHGPDRRWTVLADAALGPAAVIGRGGLALELARSQRPDPGARALLEAESVGGPPAGCRSPIVITGRREGVVVGLAAAWRTDDGGHVGVLVAEAHRRQGIGSHLLAATEAAVAEAGWACAQLVAAGPDAFYRARSRWSVAPPYSKTIDE